MTKDDIRSLFLDFFLERGHVLLPNLSLIPDDDTVLLTSAGVQQVQPFFLGMAEPPGKRLVSVQRCLRTGDIEKIGADDSHLTFFEMLGNWSIGDYFKRQAIDWSWELIGRAGFDRDRVWATVYDGESGRDEESYELWRAVGIPAERIVWLGDEHNWWAPGDTGPCGPDTEIFYDRGEKYGCGRADCKPGCECDRYVEFWNNVFTQYNRTPAGQLEQLASKNVDTGAGLERWAMLLQEKGSVFETDCFWPLIEAVANATGTRFGDPAADRSLRIIADHGRALTFLISDGVVPTPEGRGSVLRRLLRRAVMNGRQLGLRRPFLAEIVVPAVVEMMKDGYPELAERRAYIERVADTEERQFLSTIERGIILAEELLERSRQKGVVDGKAAFDLYQTHGFPLELTRDLAADHGLEIDMEGYRRAEEQHRIQRGVSDDRFAAAARNNQAYGEITEALGRTPAFLGYDTLEAQGRVAGIVHAATSVRQAEPGQAVEVVLDQTPFYAESGGQIGDTGVLLAGDTVVRVTDTQRPKGTNLIVHIGTVEGGTLRVGDEVTARVDGDRRAGLRAHHSSTHLAHRALKDVLGEGVHQEGSVVEPGRFTFDFNLPRAMTPEEIAAVEREVNDFIRMDVPVETVVMPYAEAMQTGAMALFTEKYGDRVRVVTMGPSRELCGGTHVRRTGEIGVFFILSESSVSAGIRRIECVAGDPAYRYARAQMDALRGLARDLDAQGTAQVAARVMALRESNRHAERQLEAARQEIANLKVQIIISVTATGAATSGGSGTATVIGPEQKDGFQFLVQRVDAGSLDDLKNQSDALKGRLAPCVIVLGAEVNGRAMFTASATQGLDAKGVRAGDLIKAATTAAGGKGGGNPTWAQGMGEPSKLDAGLEAARKLLEEL